jgi:hypothetical protein
MTMIPQVPTKTVFATARHQGKPLSPKQKAMIGRAAGRAYQRAKQHELHDDLSADDWRHREAREAVGCTISEAQQRHVASLMAHFCKLAGDPGEAFDWALKDQPEMQDRQLALHALHFQLARLPNGTDMERLAYAQTICKSRFHVGLDMASAQQIAQVMMTVKTRVQGHRAISKQAPTTRP